MWRPRVSLAVIALSTSALVGVGLPAEAAHAPSTRGSAGIGDPYFPDYGNGGYQVRNYRIDVGYSLSSRRLTGDTTIVAVTKKRLSRFHLDLVLRASSVKVDGRTARFRQKPHELIVTPARTLHKGARFTVRVKYAGKPGSISNHGVKPFLDTPHGALAVGQPEIAAWWFPSNDHPSDKATFDIRLRSPKGTQTVSNGRLLSKKAHGSTRTWHWRAKQPMATYLAFATWGDYTIKKGHTSSGRPYLYAYDQHLPAKTARYARQSVRRTGAATDFLARTWGRYPFGQIGGVVTNADLGYALENQTRPVYDGGFFSRSTDVSTVVHEMAHQWFGDKVALYRWRDIWLNEGFATYSEWLWSQASGGASTQAIFDDFYAQPATSSLWRLRIADPGAKHIFDDPTYYRGAMTLHLLRKRIGDTAFFRLGRQWVANNADGLGTTAEFVALAEKISGKDLGAFFHAWLYTARKPAL